MVLLCVRQSDTLEGLVKPFFWNWKGQIHVLINTWQLRHRHVTQPELGISALPVRFACPRQHFCTDSLQILWNIVEAVKIARDQWPQWQLHWIPTTQHGMSSGPRTRGNFLTRLSAWCDGGFLPGCLVSLSSCYFFSVQFSSLPAGSGRYQVSFQ